MTFAKGCLFAYEFFGEYDKIDAKIFINFLDSPSMF
jgi:hypothetical protein